MGVPRAQGDSCRPHPLFLHSVNPMLLADDERRYVDANAAACLFLRLRREEICKLTIDDLTPPSMRADAAARWTEFLRERHMRQRVVAQSWDLQMPDGPVVAVDLSSTADFRPGRHLEIVVFPAAEALNERIVQAAAPDTDVLTPREREILMLVALGNTGVQIAAQLFLSPATVQTHMVNTLIKLGARNRAHGIAIALQTGELDLEDGPHQPRFLDSRTRPPELLRD